MKDRDRQLEGAPTPQRGIRRAYISALGTAPNPRMAATANRPRSPSS